MSESPCALAADTKLETPEGALTVRGLAGKSVAVFTREPSGRVRFRMMLDVRKLAEQQPTLRIALDNGHSFRVGPSQILFKKGMAECRADALKPGDELVPAFSYPEAYAYRDDRSGAERISQGSIRVAGVEPDGSADLYTLGVNQTGCFFLSAGILCKADGNTPSSAS